MKTKFKTSYILIPSLVVIFNLFIIVFPKDVVQSARDGMGLWLNNVLPSLLPFVIGVNLMSALGVTHALGRLLERPMRVLFNVSGSGGFVMAVGLLSGYPIGAKVSSSLRGAGELSKRDGDRLICFVNNAGPLFILGAVAQGMFQNAMVGWYLICVHYISAIITGLVFRITLPERSYHDKVMTMPKKLPNKRIPFGAELSKSVVDGMETMLLIGGFIILFSVIVRILEVANVFDIIERLIGRFIPSVGNEGVIRAVLISLIEMTNGLNRLAAGGVTKSSLVIAAAMLSFGGFSIHAQSISFLGKTDISTRRYFAGKLTHTVVSVIVGLLCVPFFYGPIMNNQAVSVFKSYSLGASVSAFVYSSVFFAMGVLILILVALIFFMAKKAARIRHTSLRMPRRRRYGR